MQELRDDDPDVSTLRVLRDDGGADPATDPLLSPDVLLRGYREMRRLRLLDSNLVALQRQGRIGFYRSAQGQEAVPIAMALALREDDWVFPALRGQSIMLARGFALRAFIAQLFGNSGDLLQGRQMPSHQSGRAVHQVSWSACVARQLSQAVGAAWAMRARGATSIAATFCGEGATSLADFHAAMNFAGVWRAPCVIVCQSDRLSSDSSAAAPTASRTIAIKGRAYGIPGIRVDGDDLLAIYAGARKAIDRARSGSGPTFIEAVTSAADPADRLRKYLVKIGILTDAADSALEEELSAEIRTTLTEVETLPSVDSASLVRDVYAELPWHLREQLHVLKVPMGGAARRSAR